MLVRMHLRNRSHHSHDVYGTVCQTDRRHDVDHSRMFRIRNLAHSNHWRELRKRVRSNLRARHKLARSNRLVRHTSARNHMLVHSIHRDDGGQIVACSAL